MLFQYLQRVRVRIRACGAERLNWRSLEFLLENSSIYKLNASHVYTKHIDVIVLNHRAAT